LWIVPKEDVRIEWHVNRAETIGNAHIVAVLGLPQLNVLRGQSLDVTGLVDDAGAGRARTDINSDVVVLQLT
jgi:hypothetical protein